MEIAHCALPLAPDVMVEVLPGAMTVPSGLEPHIEARWAAAQARAGGRLFDGPVFSVAEVFPGRIAGRFVAYRLERIAGGRGRPTA